MDLVVKLNRLNNLNLIKEKESLVQALPPQQNLKHTVKEASSNTMLNQQNSRLPLYRTAAQMTMISNNLRRKIRTTSKKVFKNRTILFFRALQRNRIRLRRGNQLRCQGQAILLSEMNQENLVTNLHPQPQAVKEVIYKQVRCKTKIGVPNDPRMTGRQKIVITRDIQAQVKVKIRGLTM